MILGGLEGILKNTTGKLFIRTTRCQTRKRAFLAYAELTHAFYVASCSIAVKDSALR